MTCSFFCGCQTAPTDEEMIITTMSNFKQAYMTQDVDAIMANFSEEYSSREGDSKEEFRRREWNHLESLAYLGLAVTLRELGRTTEALAADMLLTRDSRR